MSDSKVYYSDQNALVDQRAIARELAHEMIQAMRLESTAYNANISASGQPPKPLYEALEELVDLMWLPHAGAPTPDEELTRQPFIRKFCENVPPSMRNQVLDAIAHLGHLHQMAGLLARDVLLEKNSDEVAKFLAGKDVQKDDVVVPRLRLKEAVEALSKPRIELTLTAHPTNTSSIVSMQLQRRLGKTLKAWRAGKSDRKEVLEALKAFAKTPLLPMVGGETVNYTVPDEMRFMLNYLENLYEDLDGVYRPFDVQLGKAYSEYKPQELSLNLGFHSWGSSGDKDGNAKVNADTTLLAVAAHQHAILARYVGELAPLLSELPQLKYWHDTILNAATVCGAVESDIETLLDKKGHLSEAEFTSLSQRMRTVTQNLDKHAFVQSLEEAHEHAAAMKPRALSLLRKARVFGFNFGTIEYRETAEEYARVVGELIPNYKTMDETARQNALNHLLSNPQILQEAVAKLRARFKDIEGKPYSPDDALPIAYHTLKRMEIARDFPHMVQNNVLAECQGTSNFLEALVLQHAVADTQHARAKLGIIPLFEEHAVLKQAPDIVRQALQNEHYTKHLSELEKNGGAVQQVQLAHSDNARRAGMPAARALIYRAHQELRDMIKDYNSESDHPVRLQFFEGGSQSDPYRGGVRAITATVKEFGLQEFTKMTFQGGDLLNYLNFPESSQRLFVRNITHSADLMLRPPRSNTVSAMDNRIIASLDATKEDYIRLFEDPEFSKFMDAIGYKEQARAGGNTSRAGARKASDGVVNVNAMRTIGFSETLQHAGIAPTWLGMRHLHAELQRHFPDRVVDTKFLHECYMQSPIFKDVVDRMAFGIVKSDLVELAHKSGNHPLMGRMYTEYSKAYDLCLAAMTGKEPKELGVVGGMESMNDPLALRRVFIKYVFPHAGDALGDQWRYIQLARGMQKAWANDALVDAPTRHLRTMLTHNMIDTVHHGRNTLIDDPFAARDHAQAFHIARPFANEADASKQRGVA